uniref:Uncharacterized protein n=1 Tax=virus sp. ctML55 TaxID=2827627 RepID=A0A8S5RHI5_9VIRU|nr:MAG TPA: hypothetical protein [virus sp. ctML55]
MMNLELSLKRKSRISIIDKEMLSLQITRNRIHSIVQ